VAIPLMLFLLWASAPAGAMRLQDVFDAAGPGEGYDKLIDLDPGQIYTGYMVVASPTTCLLRGNGALILLDPGGQIWAGAGSKLDVENCVITGGAYGLSYEFCANSTVTNCTIVGNDIGIRNWVCQVTITNSIIAGNYEHGIECREEYEPVMSYNDVWGNGQLNYAAFCPT
jgi:parallel beta-helix repeat protein